MAWLLLILRWYYQQSAEFAIIFRFAMLALSNNWLIFAVLNHIIHLSWSFCSRSCEIKSFPPNWITSIFMATFLWNKWTAVCLVNFNLCVLLYYSHNVIEYSHYVMEYVEMDTWISNHSRSTLYFGVKFCFEI